MTTRFRAVAVALMLSVSAFSQVPGGVADDPEHGTCAIAIATNRDMAIMVDSKLTRMSQSDEACTLPPGKPGCKAVLVRKDMLLVVTGLFSDYSNGQEWKVSAETRKLLTSLPAPVTDDSLKGFIHNWFWVLVAHYRAKPRLDLKPGLVSELMVGTRIDGAPLILKIEISFNPNGLFTYIVQKPFLVDKPSSFYSGSCRGYVGTNDEGVHRFAFSPPDAALQLELNSLGVRRNSTRTLGEFVPLMGDYERLFERIANTKNQCWIGPPYDVATWGQGADGWTANFKKDCRASAPQTAPGHKK